MTLFSLFSKKSLGTMSKNQLKRAISIVGFISVLLILVLFAMWSQSENPKDDKCCPLAINANKNANAHFQKGLGSYAVRDYELAVNDFSEALGTLIVESSISDSAAEIYLRRGMAYHLLGALNLALSDFSEVIRLSTNDVPRRAIAHHMKGTVYFDLANYSKAVDEFSDAISISPNDAYHFSRRGDAHSWLRNYSEALSDYNTALQIQPSLKVSLQYKIQTVNTAISNTQ